MATAAVFSNNYRGSVVVNFLLLSSRRVFNRDGHFHFRLIKIAELEMSSSSKPFTEDIRTSTFTDINMSGISVKVSAAVYTVPV
jgi:hypothetical protein